MSQPDVFGTSPLPPPKALKQPLSSVLALAEWDDVRDSHVPPRYRSEYTGSAPYRAEFIEGCRLLGIDSELYPQQLVLADAINAVTPEGMPLARFFAALLPRRSSKTTTILAIVLGRCMLRANYLVGYTMCTTGQKARDRFLKDIVPMLLRAYPDDDTRPFQIRKAAGSERIVFDNGSIFQVLTPTGEAFRSDAFDCVVLDEAGEAKAGEGIGSGADLLAGVLPTLDTRRSAQVIVAGTAGEFRDGNLLWDALQDGREKVPRTGIVEYSAPADLVDEDIATWELVEPIVRAAHPGIGTLTDLDTIAFNYRKFSGKLRTKFLREYLSVFDDLGGSQGIISPPAWTDCAASLPPGLDWPELPKTWVMGIAADRDQQAAAIVGSWRDEQGRAHTVLIDQRDGVAWLAPRVRELADKYKVKVAHDNFGVVLSEVLPLKQSIPLRLAPQTTENIKTAAALFVKEVHMRNLSHYGQDKLTASVLSARKRVITTGWGFGKAPGSDDLICAIEAASMSLRYFDTLKARKPLPRMIAAS